MSPKFLIIFVLFFIISSNASLTFEKRSSVGVERVTIVLEKNNFKLISNTNFYSEKLPYYFGVFERKPSASELEEYNQLVRLKPKNNSVQSQTFRVYIQEATLDYTSELGQKVIRTLQKLSLKSWQTKRGVQLSTQEQVRNTNCIRRELHVCLFQFGFLNFI